MIIRFVEEAAAGFLDGISYYEKKQPGLGRRFKTEIEKTLIWLANIRTFVLLDQVGIAGSTSGSFLITFLTS